jgi:hypothetical protein
MAVSAMTGWCAPAPAGRVLKMVLLIIAGACALACERARESSAQAAPADSISPAMRTALEQFRTTVTGPPPTALAGAATGRDALIQAFVNAVERADTAALIGMTMNRAEFAYLYYPHSIYTHRPYEMDADTQWLLMKAAAEKGLTRILGRFGGRPFNFLGYNCDTAAVQEGPNRFWTHCTINSMRAGVPQTMRWFGSIWERDGLFKFVSFANDL